MLALSACAGTPPQPACSLRQPAAEFVMPRLPLDIIPVTLDLAIVPFILDTGANASILSSEAGKALGFRPTTGRAFVGEGAGGEVLAYPARVSILRLGNGALPGAVLFVAPLFNMPLSQFPAFGLIGTDIVANWAMDLDAANARLLLYNEEPCIVTGPAWPVRAAQIDISDNHSNYIEASILLDGRPFDAVVDTGAARSLLGAQVARRLHLDLSRDQPVAGNAVGGLHFTGHEHRIEDVSLGGVRLGPMSFEVSTRDLPGTDLLLGQDFLHAHRIFVSFRQHRLWFDPLPTRPGMP